MPKRAIEFLTDHNISKRSAARISAALNGTTESVERKRCEQRDTWNMNTPYGPLVRAIEVPQINGDSFQWEVINPCALIWFLCEDYGWYGDFLKEHTDGQCSVLLYSDETNPQSMLRPDASREVQRLYWSLKEYPHWLRSQDRGWFTIGVMKTTRQDLIPGGLSYTRLSIQLVLANPANENLQGSPDLQNLQMDSAFCWLRSIHAQASSTYLSLRLRNPRGCACFA